MEIIKSSYTKQNSKTGRITLKALTVKLQIEIKI